MNSLLLRCGIDAVRAVQDRLHFNAKKILAEQKPNQQKQVAPELHNDAMSPLFLAVVEATEEAVYNSMLKTTTVSGRDGHTLEALPIAKTIKILEQYRVLNVKKRLPGVAEEH